MDSRDLTVRIKGDTSDFERSMKKTSVSANEGKTSFLKLSAAVATGQAIFAATTKALHLMDQGVRDVLKAYQESQDLIAQTNAVLKSTGGIAGVSAQQVTDLATAWQKQTQFSDEAVRGAENVLLTFTGISKDIFPQTTGAVLDIATALHEDLQSASIQVGKALQDPILGVTALRRVGVNFNETQKETIKNLVNTGQKAKAQAIILKELQTEFGGSALAAGQTFSGQLARLKNSLNDVEEKVGGVIVNALTPFALKAMAAIQSIDWDKIINRTVTALKTFWSWLTKIYDGFIQVATRIYTFLEPSFLALWNTLEQKVLPTLSRLWHEVIEPLLPVIGVTLVLALKLAIDTFNALLQVITPVINFLLDHKQVVIDFAAAFTVLAIAMKFEAITAAFIGNMQTIMASIVGVRGSVTELFAKISGGTAMGGIAVAGALADIALVAQAVQTVIGAINAMNNAANAAKAQGAGEADAIRAIQNSTILSPAQKAKTLNSLYSQQRAIGGPVSSDTPYLVGERGPEIFVPKSSGTIVPNDKIAGGNRTINIANINLNTVSAVQEFFNQLDRDNILVGKGLSPARGI